MITIPTVLVLGAGASKPFGFPAGRELLEIIVKAILAPGFQEFEYRMGIGGRLLGCGFSENDLKDFAQRLQFSQRNSVDAFLEHQSDFVEMGKAAIVSALVPFEQANDPLRIGDWCRYLFNQMNTSFEDFNQNKLSVITYNYDRSLEYFLCNSLAYSYGKSASECANKIQSIPIIHLHGQLGKLIDFASDGRPYDNNVDTQIINACAHEIRIIHEVASTEPQFEVARNILRNAERICFLGFGYDETNLNRLIGTGDRRIEMYGKSVFGSALHMTAVEKFNVQCQIFDRMQLGRLGQDNLDVLRETGVLLLNLVPD